MSNRKKAIVGILLLGALAIATSLTTSSIIGQVIEKEIPAKASRSKTIALPGNSTETVTTTPQQAARARFLRASSPPAFDPDERSIARYLARDFSITTRGNQVRVAMEVEAFDKEPNHKYFWSLLVLDESGKLLSARDYLGQAFSIPPDRAIRPAFAEEITLEPGTYRIEAVLYCVGTDYDLSKLRSGPRDREPRAMHKNKLIRVAR